MFQHRAEFLFLKVGDLFLREDLKADVQLGQAYLRKFQ